MNNLPAPLVTVVIPCFNLAGSVQRAIKSVQDQTLNNFELFVVNDGSTDGSEQAILDAIEGDPRCHYIFQKNAGVANARNHGVFSGDAPFVCCLDADDAIDPRFLEVCVSALEADRSIGIAYTGLYFIKPDGSSGLSNWPEAFNFDNALRGMNQIPTCNVARREVWERLGGQRQRFAPHGAGEEDGEMWLRAGAFGFKGKKITDGGLFLYSWMSGRVSGNRQHQMVDYRAWHPWTRDGKHPFASCATPKLYSHPVRQYDVPTVSVVVPVGEKHISTLVDALDSLEAQTFRNWEAIVVWDAPVPIPDLLTKAYPYVKWVKTDGNKGAGYARNRGVEKARSSLLLYLDADDWLDPEAISYMISAYAETRAIVYTDYVGKSYVEKDFASKFGDHLLFYDEKDKHAIIRYNSADYDCVKAVRQPFQEENGYPYLWNLITSLVPKEWHDEIGGFDEAMPSWEDWDYFIRLAKAGKCFVRIPEPLVIYRFYTGNRREIGLQSIPDLIQYLQKKYEGVNVMPCGSCGKKTYAQTGTNPPSMPASSMPQAERNIALNDNDYELCLYDHPNRGSHRVVGLVTGTDYGYRGGGESFLVHKADKAAQPNIFRSAEIAQIIETKVKPDPIVDPRPPKPLVSAPPISESEAPKEIAKEERGFDLQLIPGVTPIIAQELNARNVHNIQDLLDFGGEKLQSIKGIGPARAATILKYAHEHAGD